MDKDTERRMDKDKERKTERDTEGERWREIVQGTDGRKKMRVVEEEAGQGTKGEKKE